MEQTLLEPLGVEILVLVIFLATVFGLFVKIAAGIRKARAPGSQSVSRNLFYYKKRHYATIFYSALIGVVFVISISYATLSFH